MSAATNPRSVEDGEKITLLRSYSLGHVLMLAWALIAPISFPIGLGSVKIIPSDLLGVVTVLYCAWQVVLGVRVTGLLLAVITFYVFVIFTTVFHIGDYSDPTFAFLQLARMVFNFSPLILIILQSRKLNEDFLRLLLATFLVGCTFGLVLGLLAHFLNWGFVMRATSVQAYDFGRGAVNRAGGLMGDTSAFGHLAGLSTAVGMALLLTPVKADLKLKVLAFVQILLFPIVIYTSLSRAAIVDVFAVVTAVTALSLVGYYKSSANIIWIFITGLVIFAFLFGLTQAFPLESQILFKRIGLGSLANQDLDRTFHATSSGRDVVWSNVWGLLEQHPIIGGGYKSLSNIYHVPSDNVFLMFLAEFGIVGTIFLISGIVFFTTKIFLHGWRHRNSERMLLILPAVWVGQIFHSAFVDLVTFGSSFPCLLLLIGALTLQSPRKGLALKAH